MMEFVRASRHDPFEVVFPADVLRSYRLLADVSGRRTHERSVPMRR